MQKEAEAKSGAAAAAANTPAERSPHAKEVRMLPLLPAAAALISKARQQAA